MPHLSPMSWLFALTIFWLSCLLFTSSMWWATPHAFTAGKLTCADSKSHTWSW